MVVENQQQYDSETMGKVFLFFLKEINKWADRTIRGKAVTAPWMRMKVKRSTHTLLQKLNCLLAGICHG
jgi:hypothetical protein